MCVFVCVRVCVCVCVCVFVGVVSNFIHVYFCSLCVNVFLGIFRIYIYIYICVCVCVCVCVYFHLFVCTIHVLFNFGSNLS